MNLASLAFISFLVPLSIVSAHSMEASTVQVELTSYESENITIPKKGTDLTPEGMKIVYKVLFSISGTDKRIIIPNIYGTTEEITLSIEGKNKEELTVESRVFDEGKNKELVNSCGPISVPIAQEKDVQLFGKCGIKYLNREPTAGSSLLTMRIKMVPR